jgi:hypothetical protein
MAVPRTRHIMDTNRPDLLRMLEAFHKATLRGTDAAASFLTQALKQLVGFPNPTRHISKTGNVWYEHGSPLGTPPWKRSGDGQKNIGWRRVANGVRIGGNEKNWYMREHDAGMPYGQRPWFMANDTWHRYLPAMIVILKRHTRARYTT